MALVSPGVEVNVIDESFYTPGAPGTVPMIFVATAENKINGSGTGTAAGTIKANAGKPYLLTSQRDLAETFGDPIFYTDANNNPVNAGELNEYGLQAAYSFLGVSNRAWVVRADIDLGKLNPQADAPQDDPQSGSYWLDTQITQWGLFEWSGAPATTTGGQTFTTQAPVVITDETKTVGSAPFAPKTSIGSIGDYAIVAVSNVIRAWYKSPGNALGQTAGQWVQVGSADWKASWATVQGDAAAGSYTGTESFSVSVEGDTAIVISEDNGGGTGTLAAQVLAINTALSTTGVSAAAVGGVIEFYSEGGSVEIIEGAGDYADRLGLTPGVYNAPQLNIAPHTQVPEFGANDTSPRPTGSLWVKTTTPNAGANYRLKQWNDATKLWDNITAPLYDDSVTALYNLDRAGGGANLDTSNVYVQHNAEAAGPVQAGFKLFGRVTTGATTITSAKILIDSFTAASHSIDISESDAGSAAFKPAVTVSFSTNGNVADAEVIAGAIASAGFENVTADVDSQNRIVITHAQGGDIKLVDTTGAMALAGFAAFDAALPTTTTNLYHEPGTTSSTDPEEFRASLWKALEYTASDDAPGTLAADGELWYNSVVDEVDMMVHDGQNWVGYRNEVSDADPAGPIVASGAPAQQSDGSALVNGDIWIDTSDIENYPTIYVFENAGTTVEGWKLRDSTDQTTPNGVLFADARYNTAGANSDEAGDIAELLTSDYLDPDAPDPALYPKGMLLWNLRRSGFNVKRFERNYIDLSTDNPRANDESTSDYYPHRWVTDSPNQPDGAGSFGRMAQRAVVVKALQAMVNSNEEIRDDESRVFNLMATPGYSELIGEMISLNYDRKLSAFVIADTPARLTPDATSLNDWATNVRGAVEDNDIGAVSFDEYVGMYYPWGFTSDNAGNNVVVPPSHMALRTIALNDQVAYPWFAPAGTRRGGVTNATSSGYVNNEGEFVAVALNEGQRDTLYENKINPITFLNGAGLVVFGQKTRARNASALDRVNVARLIVYMRGRLDALARPYLFEPNDKITRDQVKAAAESLCLELVGQRALYDYLVVCDESNNTPARIDRNELYLDIAIEPVKAIEFIYIPLRIKNTGEIASL